MHSLEIKCAALETRLNCAQVLARASTPYRLHKVLFSPVELNLQLFTLKRT